MPVLKAKINSQWVALSSGGVDEIAISPTEPTAPGIELWVDEAATATQAVPPGGAINSILSKSSAVDYATQWTTTPILTDLSVVDITTPTMILQRTGGSPPVTWYTQIDAGGSLCIGSSSDPNQFALAANATVRNVHIGGDLFVGGGNLTVNGTIASKHAVRAAALVNGTNGTTITGYGLNNAQRLGVGNYRFTLGTTYTNVWAVATIHAPAWGYAIVSVASGSQVDTATYNSAGTVTDSNHMIIIFGL